ncbi:MAG TPA: ABC transporter permease [Phycisphaerales bacterium]|nr:ABC transporter permease [Phycisphaerales bacterium]
MAAGATTGATGAGRSLLKRVLLAQEIGLVAVILLMALGLTLFGGTKNKRVQTESGQWEVVQVNKFLDAQNLVLLAKDASFVAIMAVGMTGVIVMGGIDLSVGSVYALCALVGGMFLRYNWANGPPPLSLGGHGWLAWTLLVAGLCAAAASGAALKSAGSAEGTKKARAGGLTLAAIGGAAVLVVIGAFVVSVRDEGAPAAAAYGWKTSTMLSVVVGVGVCCLVGAICGLINGSLVVGLNVHPFIITLGMMTVVRGIAFVLTDGLSVSGVPEGFTRGFFKAGFWEQAIGVPVYPVPVVVMIIVALAGAFVLARTVYGRRVYAIGGNETAARYAGIPVGRVKILTFTLMGLLAGLSACVSLGYLGSASSNDGIGYELSVIAAAVIGGASLSGGRGSAVGAVLGAVLIQLINNAMIILDINTNYTNIVMGAAIVAAVVLDQTKARLLPGGR